MLGTRGVLLAIAASALTFAGCGNSSKTDAASTLSRAELIAKGDVICASVHTNYHANGYSTPQSIARLAPRVAAYEQAGVTEMRKLIPPPSMVHDWQQIINGDQAVAVATAKFGQDAKENNLKAATPLIAAIRRPQEQALAIAKRDGFKNCSQAS